MEPFEQASHRAQIMRLRRLAENALAQYALEVAEFRTLLHLENTTFRVVTDDNQTFVLRINRPNHRAIEEIKSEAMWLAALCADTELVVPRPVANEEGGLVTQASAPGVPEERFCVLFQWVDGQFYRDRLSPVALERVGRFTAQLHQHAEIFNAPEGFSRPNVQFGDEDKPGEIVKLLQKGFRDGAEIIAPQDLATFTMARHTLQDALGELDHGKEWYGLIHADLHHGNYLFHGEDVRAVDFDDCGWGHYLYDLAVTQWYLQGRADYKALCEAHLDGYRAVRGLAEEQVALLPTFRAARTLLMGVYIAGRVDNPQLRERAPGIVAQCAAALRDFLAGKI